MPRAHSAGGGPRLDAVPARAQMSHARLLVDLDADLDQLRPQSKRQLRGVHRGRPRKERAAAKHGRGTAGLNVRGRQDVDDAWFSELPASLDGLVPGVVPSRSGRDLEVPATVKPRVDPL